MLRLLYVFAFLLISITTSFSQFDEIEMDDSQIIEEDPRDKLPAEEQYFLDQINSFVDYFYDFRNTSEMKYKEIHEKIVYQSNKSQGLKTKLFIFDENTSKANRDFINLLLTPEKLNATKKEFIFIIEYKMGSIINYNFGASPDSK